MNKRAKNAAELIANGIMISVQSKTGRVVYNTAEKSFDHHDLMSAARKGYEQAEKDNALTWEDIYSIIYIYLGIIRDKYFRDAEPEILCKELLRKFNEQYRKK